MSRISVKCQRCSLLLIISQEDLSSFCCLQNSTWQGHIAWWDHKLSLARGHTSKISSLLKLLLCCSTVCQTLLVNKFKDLPSCPFGRCRDTVVLWMDSLGCERKRGREQFCANTNLTFNLGWVSGNKTLETGCAAWQCCLQQTPNVWPESA